VVSAPGYAPLTMAFVVDLGAIELRLNDPRVLPRVGGTREVVLCAYPGRSTAPTAFALAADTTIQFVTEEVPSVVITSITLPADDQCTYFAVQGLGVGSAKVTVTSPNFRAFSTTIMVAP